MGQSVCLYLFIMQKIIAELCAVSASRKNDLKLIKEKQTETKTNQTSLSSDDFLSRQRIRAEKQKTNFVILKKNRNLDASTRQDILFMIFQMINNIDEEIGNKLKEEAYAGISDQCPEFGQLGINDLIQIMDKFVVYLGIRNQKLKTITRPNNSNLLIDFAELVSRVAKQKLKQAIFEMIDIRKPKMQVPKEYQSPNATKMQERKLKIRKMHTEIIEERVSIKNRENQKQNSKFFKHKKQVKKENLRRELFEKEHREFMSEKKKQFMGRFDMTNMEQRANQMYVELMQLNEGNNQIINKFRAKCQGEKSPKMKLKSSQVDLYSNSQKKQRYDRIYLQINELHKYQNLPQSKSSSELKEYRENYLGKVIEYNNAKMRGIGKQDEVPINSWLKLTLKNVKSIEYPLKLFFLEDKNNTDKQSQSFPNLTDNLPIVRTSFNTNGTPANLPFNNVTSRFRRQIAGCFSRKKMKQLLEGPRVSPNKKHTASSVQKCNTTLVLPYIPASSLGSKNQREDHERKKKIEEGNLLSEILQKKIQSNPQNEEKFDVLAHFHKKKISNNQPAKLPCSIIQFDGNS